MKKILFIISIVALLFVASCSAAMESSTTVANMNQQITYDFNDFEFSGISRNDLLYYISDDTEDMKIMLQLVLERGIITDLLESDNGVIDTLGFISEASGKSIAILLNYSATELNEVAEANGITLTVDDIVGFMDLLKVKEELPQRVGFNKVDYLELLIGREITEVEETGFDDFQVAYTALYDNNNYDITNKTFLEIVDDLDALVSEVVYTQELLDSIELGYDLFEELMD